MSSSHSRHHHEEEQQELQISSFIKDPTTLKLLILAGTNIKSTELSTVAKCTNLIKLDLSSNMLSQVPILFENFVQLKILYLHDNNIFNIQVKNQTVQYMTLFNNPYKNYRPLLIQNNPKLMALDYHIITQKQRCRKQEPLLFTELKWPIVQASSTLQNEEDYLNLLKAEIFVITNLYKRANSIEHVESIFSGLVQFRRYQKKIQNLTDQMKIKKACVINAVNQWKKFVHKKAKLYKFLQSKQKQHLLYNNLDIRKSKRSPQTNLVIERFIQSIRERLQARKILQPQLKNYRQFIPTSKKLVQIYKNASKNLESHKLYFLKSQLHFLDKIFLYAKRLLFNKKEYDLCDNFQKIVSREKKEFYIYRVKSKDMEGKYFLKQSIRRTISLIIGQKNLDRRHFLYTKKGHKMIGIKNRQKLDSKNQQKLNIFRKFQQVTRKLQRKYDNYDSLISFTISNDRMFELLIKIIRFFNAGNSQIILSNQTAYFQTQVIFDDDQKVKEKQRIFVGLNFFIKRVLAANVIQKFWRRKMQQMDCKINVIKTIKQKRAKNIISHWIREMPFRQRLHMNKLFSYKKTVQKTTDLYIQLDIYMKLPHPTNLLKLQKYESISNGSKDIFYEALHKNTYVEIIQLCKRKWIRIVFPSIEKALQAYKLFLFATFKFYYNGFYLQLFNYYQAQDQSQLQVYEKRVLNLYKIQIKKSLSQSSVTSLSKKLTIQNIEPYFVWAQVGQRGIQQKYDMQKRSLPISIFVYNKHQKPLKINCQFNWINPSSIYSYKTQILKSTSFHTTSIRSRTPTKKLSSLSRSKAKQDTSFILGQDVQRHYLTKIKSTQKRDRRNSQISPHNTVLLRNHRFKNRHGATQNIQVDLLSHTLSIKRR